MIRLGSALNFDCLFRVRLHWQLARVYHVAVLDDNGLVVLRHLRILNSRQGFATLHQSLIQLSADTNDDIRIAMEATGHYHLNLLLFLQANAYPTFAYNPFL
ncbi:hypothetical protein BMS77_08250, partial [Leuconostoc pseudomesenteroides]